MHVAALQPGGQEPVGRADLRGGRAVSEAPATPPDMESLLAFVASSPSMVDLAALPIDNHPREAVVLGEAGRPLPWCSLRDMSRDLPGSLSLYPSTSHTRGTGTKRFLLCVPTSFPTEPLPWPVQGSRNRYSNP